MSAFEGMAGYSGGRVKAAADRVAHAGTPKAIVEAVAAPLAADLKRPETVARFKAIGTPNPTRRTNSAPSSPPKTSNGARWIQQAGIEAE